MSRPYPVHEAKSTLSLLRRVEQGTSVTISERGLVIARVVPVERPRSLPSRLRRTHEEFASLSRDARQRDLTTRLGFATP